MAIFANFFYKATADLEIIATIFTHNPAAVEAATNSNTNNNNNNHHNKFQQTPVQTFAIIF
jgi:hypothetical protein